MGFFYRIVVGVVERVVNKFCKCLVVNVVVVYIGKRGSGMVEMMYKKCFEFMFGVMEVLGIEGVGLGRVDEGMFR